MNKSPITTHVLDTTMGRPAQGVPVLLEIQVADRQWKELGRGITNEDGRILDLLPPTYPLEKGIYRINFDIDSYFGALGRNGFYPYIPIIFQVLEPSQHYHVPLLLNPYGYSTYRGS